MMQEAWLFRFLAGLSCRTQDARAAIEAIPELIDGSELSMPRSSFEFYLDRSGVELYGGMRNGRLLEDVRSWVKSAKSSDDLSSSTPTSEPCPAAYCPMRPSEGNLRDAEPDVGITLEMMTVEGSLGGENTTSVKLAWDRFLGVVRATHSGQGRPTKVYVTDPFILSEEGEDGATRPVWSSYLKYLDELKVDPRFELIMWNGRLQSCKTSRIGQAWENSILTKYPEAKVVWPSGSTPVFHDRFYLAADSSGGDLRGVFGPSLNGLGSSPIFLVGQLEERAINTFQKVINRRTMNSQFIRPKSR